MNKLDTLFGQAYELFEQKEFSRAVEKLNSAENLLDQGDSESQASLLNFKGFNYLGMDALGKARECFEKSLSINPASSQACAGLGEVFYLCEYDYEAKAMYEWALDYNAGNRFAAKGLAKVNKNLGLPESHNTLNLETSVSRKDSFYHLVGEAYRLFSEKRFRDVLEKITEAELYFNRQLPGKDTIQKVSSLENFKGFSYLALQEVENAKLAFENSLNLNPNSSQACAGLGEVLFLLGMETEAKTMFEWAVKNNHTNMFAKEGLAKVNRILGYPAEHSSVN
ncbi:MAG: hypothetical protein HF300_17735 [Ignavibacteria bacterium]|jgi:tetratricopeptide (TPR) repeat protein|nr:hypothetical protein [Ignavibacteria bacterium]MCU7500884.1 hypothetical protein [Ignavibacteria bacterium]MCU7514405.1 hypothetical protein [Ignavibacteria bacterium]MCU7518458.1 hypothetical protein [Ignavibacteria bacterium]